MPNLRHATIAVLASMSLVACTAQAPETQSNSDAPDEIQDGTLTFGVSANYPPLEFRDTESNELTGFDVDLGNAVAEELGVEAAWEETGFEQMVNAANTGRIDAILSGMADLEERREVITFIDYLASSPQFFTSEDVQKAEGIQEPTDLCGETVAASRNGSFPDEIEAWSKENCEEPIEVTGTDGSIEARLYLKQARVVGAVQSNETLPYVMEQEPNTFVPMGEPFAPQLFGIGVAKQSDEFVDAVAGAMAELIENGTYQDLLDKWGMSDNAVDEVTVNGSEHEG